MKRRTFSFLMLLTIWLSLAFKPFELNKPEAVQVDEIINQIMESIPSPLEISFIIKEASDLYNKGDLNNESNAENYDTQFKKSLNLGVYGADLGYANLYGKNQDVLTYLTSFKSLADGLSIGQFYDYAAVKRLAEGSGNLDSLLFITQENMNKINYHLREQNREALSILIITGGWIEAAHLTGLVYKRTRKQVLREKIGEQKTVLDQLLLVLDVYKDIADFPELISDLSELERMYREKVEFEISYGEPTTVEENGTLVVIDNNETNINVSEGDLLKIVQLITKIRNKIIS